jgi:hypothetical protein
MSHGHGSVASKNENGRPPPTDKTDKTTPVQVLSVLSVTEGGPFSDIGRLRHGVFGGDLRILEHGNS